MQKLKFLNSEAIIFADFFGFEPMGDLLFEKINSSNDDSDPFITRLPMFKQQEFQASQDNQVSVFASTSISTAWEKSGGNQSDASPVARGRIYLEALVVSLLTGSCASALRNLAGDSSSYTNPYSQTADVCLHWVVDGKTTKVSPAFRNLLSRLPPSSGPQDSQKKAMRRLRSEDTLHVSLFPWLRPSAEDDGHGYRDRDLLLVTPDEGGLCCSDCFRLLVSEDAMNFSGKKSSYGSRRVKVEHIENMPNVCGPHHEDDHDDRRNGNAQAHGTTGSGDSRVMSDGPDHGDFALHSCFKAPNVDFYYTY